MSQEQSAEAALEAVFGESPAAPVPAPEPVEPEVVAEAEEPVAEEAAEPEEQEEAPAPEPEFEIVVDGAPVQVKGAEQVKELLQKGFDYSKKSAAIARQTEALLARSQAVEQQERFMGLIAGDVAELKALDQRLEEYQKIDWGQAFETDPFKALQLKEQRDQLREARSAKFNELNAKHEQFKTGQAQAARQMLEAEHAALLEKVPVWRNPETAAKEKAEVARLLVEKYGYNPAELNLTDHRMLVAAKDLLDYHRLRADRDNKVKAAREAPPVVKPVGAAKPNPKAEFAKARGLIKAHGQKGNHRAQEAMVEQLLSKTFKI